MKLIVLLCSAILTGLFAFFPAEKNISGTWVMQTNPGTSGPTIIRISMQEGVWEGKLDMPGQQVYDRGIHSIIANSDSVFIRVSKEGKLIKAALVNENTLAGQMLFEGISEPVQFSRQ